MDITSILGALIGSGVITTVIELICKLIDSKSGKYKQISGEILTCTDKITEVNNKLNDHIAQQQERDADRARARILRFADDLRRGQKASEESFIDTLKDIDFYEEYCSEHDGYKNNRAVVAISYVKSEYEDSFKNKDKFLV